MSKINKQLVVETFLNLKDKTKNKLWGILLLFVTTETDNKIERNKTYIVNSKDLQNLLQSLFYFGDNPREYTSATKVYYRLSQKWNSEIEDLLLNIKPNILDAAIFYFKDKQYTSSNVSSGALVADFISLLNLEQGDIDNIFNSDFEEMSISLEDYEKNDVLEDIKVKLSINNQNDTLSFETDIAISSHPGELKRAPFTQTLYSGSNILKVLLLSDFDTENYYPILKPNLSGEVGTGINKIFYGAPGTGKSHKVNEIIRDNIERSEIITFHPEYDYSSFVGCYKPTMVDDDIRYEFVPQPFANIYIKAWNDLDNNYYLVIEEINRGNCAEIFGDIFQLLDRRSNYQITPSKELSEYLCIAFKENQNTDGQHMKLPPNLSILATMNTSDQSLFPMDSAFKRRWDWEYIPINYDELDENRSSKFKVQLSDTEVFSWLSFIKAVNIKIKENSNLGMDKCIGNYFILPTGETITLKTFINKVIFYLWNDVFKDEIEESSIFKNQITYENFFPLDSEGRENTKIILEYLDIEIKNIRK